MSLGNANTVGPQARYEEYLRQGRFMIQKSASTGEYVFFPRIVAPSGATDLEWTEATGVGTLYAITQNRTRQGDYNIALVELDEGVRMMSCLPDVDTAPIGSRLTARIDTSGEEPRVVFDLAEVGS